MRTYNKKSRHQQYSEKILHLCVQEVFSQIIFHASLSPPPFPQSLSKFCISPYIGTLQHTYIRRRVHVWRAALEKNRIWRISRT